MRRKVFYAWGNLIVDTIDLGSETLVSPESGEAKASLPTNKFGIILGEY